jgi:hypothetical protein
MPELAWNKHCWDGEYNWADRGEEWSNAWGGSESQWFGCLYPRLHRFLPVTNLLEIAPGFGRWTHYLLNYVQGRYTGIDLSKECIDHCQTRFSGFSHAEFSVNDGVSLDGADDGLYDLVFSFDSLVHADSAVHQRYVPEILRKLSENGVAFIHHSNWADAAPTVPNQHHRSEDVGASLYADLIKQAGGHVMLQECLNWGGEEKIDAFTLFCRAERDVLPETVLLENSHFMLEATVILESHSAYTKIA